MSLSPSPPRLPAMDSTLGAMEVGGVVGTFLFGIETLQTFHYFRRFSQDPAYLKWTVALLWWVASAPCNGVQAQSGQVSRAGTLHYDMALALLTHRDLLRAAAAHPDTTDLPPAHDPILGPAVLHCAGLFSRRRCRRHPIRIRAQSPQFFFANRVRLLSGRWFMTIVCWSLTTIRFGCTFAMMGVVLNISSLGELEAHYQWLMALGLSLGVGVDVLVAGSMCWCLWRLRSDGVVSTRKVVDKLILWTLESGIATGGTSIGLLAFFFARSDLSWFPFYLILGKLFSNSMLAALNGRSHLRQLDRRTEPSTKSGSALHMPVSSGQMEFLTPGASMFGTTNESSDYTEENKDPRELHRYPQ
ncbi:unnamed protein product [Mycena citricolor]|uniref:DUF6534 domain-containing protein n=1 Tax=Mycena citricolor TaxID=2018698 RepID=A0AAD2HWJ3_9AGAR|nr:unnamed protein product [Mycena citricolor]